MFLGNDVRNIFIACTTFVSSEGNVVAHITVALKGSHSLIGKAVVFLFKLKLKAESGKEGTKSFLQQFTV